MDRLPRVTDVQYLDGRKLRLVFSDGLVREFDFEGVLTGILATVDCDLIFPQAMIDKTSGTLCWLNGIDLDPDVLHGITIRRLFSNLLFSANTVYSRRADSASLFLGTSASKT